MEEIMVNMEKNQKLLAICGLDYVRDRKWRPVRKTMKEWKGWANKQALQKRLRNKIGWVGVCSRIENSEGEIRISFATMGGF